MSTPLKWSAKLKKTKAEAITLRDGSLLNYPGFYIITNATASNDKIIQIWSKTAGSFSLNASNITDDEIGTYDIDADVFTNIKSNTPDYLGVVSQGGTSDPTAIDKYNSLGSAIVFAYVSTGAYTMTIPNATSSSLIFFGNTTGSGVPVFIVVANEFSNVFQIQTFDKTGTLTDSLLALTPMQVFI